MPMPPIVAETPECSIFSGAPRSPLFVRFASRLPRFARPAMLRCLSARQGAALAESPDDSAAADGREPLAASVYTLSLAGSRASGRAMISGILRMLKMLAFVGESPSRKMPIPPMIIRRDFAADRPSRSVNRGALSSVGRFHGAIWAMRLRAGSFSRVY